MSVIKLVIISDTSAIQVRETISGAYAVTGTDGLPLTSGNFFTFDEAAQAGLGIMLRAAEATEATEGLACGHTDMHYNCATCAEDAALANR